MDLHQAWLQVGLLIAAVIVAVEAARKIPWVDALCKTWKWFIYVLVAAIALTLGMFDTLNALFMNLSPLAQKGIITLMVVVGAIGTVAFVNRVKDRGKNGNGG